MVIVVGIVIVVFLIGVIDVSLCVVASRYDNDDEEQMKYLKGMKKKDDDVPM